MPGKSPSPAPATFFVSLNRTRPGGIQAGGNWTTVGGEAGTETAHLHRWSIRDSLREECNNFCELLVSDAETARREIQMRIKKRVLTPRETPDGMVLEVCGDVELRRAGDVLVESSLEGIADRGHYFQVSSSIDPSP
jgi:hypothetical protein